MSSLPVPEETPEHTAAKAFGKSIPPDFSVSENSRESFREIWKKAATFGLFDLLIPRKRLDVESAISALEGLGEGCENGGFLLAIGAHCLGVGAPLAKFGSAAQASLLSAMRDGSVIAAFAATEPDAGSDVMSLTTRFWTDGDNYVLHGAKCFITNVREADLFLVFATKDPRLHSRGVSAFLVPGDRRGLAVGVDEPRMGLHGCSMGSLFLDNVVIPKSALLGRPGGGAAVFRHAMLWERSLILAAQVGVLRHQLLYCSSHVKTRRQFGRPIGSNQYVAGRIVDLLARYTTCRLIVRYAATKLAADELTMGEASLVKLIVSEAVLASSLDAFRTHGAFGFMSGCPAEADLRNSLGGLIYSGTSDIQKVIVASELGLADSWPE